MRERDENTVERQREDEEEQSRSSYDDMHPAPQHRSNSHVLHRRRVAKWEESPKHLNLSAPPLPAPPGNMSTALPCPKTLFSFLSSKKHSRIFLQMLKVQNLICPNLTFLEEIIKAL